MAPRHFLLCNNEHGQGLCTPLVYHSVCTARFRVLKLQANIWGRKGERHPYIGIRIFDAGLYQQALTEAESWQAAGDNPMEHSLYLSLVEGLQIELRRTGFFGMKLLDTLTPPQRNGHARSFDREVGEMPVDYELDAIGLQHLADFFFAVKRPAAAWVVLQQVQRESRDRFVQASNQEVKIAMRRRVAELVDRLFPSSRKSAVSLEQIPTAEVLVVPVVYGEGFFRQKLRSRGDSELVQQLLEAYEDIKRLKAALPLVTYEEVLNVTR